MVTSSALVTGGLKGIGLDISKRLAARGLHVYATTRNKASARGDLSRVTVLECDLSSESSQKELVEQLPLIDVLVNNAGHMEGFDLDQYDSKARDHMLQLNLIAPIELGWLLGKKMSERGSGRIINNTSIAAHIGHPDVWYGATKAGLLNATKSLARALGKHGVAVNAVAAGPVDDTDMISSIPEVRRVALKNASILERFATTDEVAKCVE